MSTTKREPPVWKLLRSIGAKKRRDYFILDEFDNEFFLKFDVAEDPETPAAKGTADILIYTTGSHPLDYDNGIRVISNASEAQIIRFLFALGVSRFSEHTRKALYERNRPIRTKEQHDA